jgi:small-conductance mechanosensitive channel
MFKIISKDRYNKMAKTESALTEQLEANKRLKEYLEIVRAEVRDAKSKQNNCEKVAYQRLESSKILSNEVLKLKNHLQQCEDQKKKVTAKAKEALEYLRLMRRGAKSPSVQKAIDTLKGI